MQTFKNINIDHLSETQVWSQSSLNGLYFMSVIYVAEEVWL